MGIAIRSHLLILLVCYGENSWNNSHFRECLPRTWFFINMDGEPECLSHFEIPWIPRVLLKNLNQISDEHVLDTIAADK